jgi:predicted MPP superfamily phosphohydrolase
MMELTRRQWLKSAAIVAGTCSVDALWLEPAGLRISHHDLRTEPSRIRPVRILQISDLHLRAMDSHAEQIAKAANAASADLLIFTGDAIDDAGNVGLLDDFLSRLNGSTRKIAILGNWEYWGGVHIGDLRRTYERHQCELLVNQGTSVQFGDRRLRLIGLDDLVGGSPDLRAALRSAPQHDEDTSILLEHCPAFRDLSDAMAARSDFACMLSGHTHGGQVAPLGWAPLRPPGSGPYVRGWYRSADRIPMYVSRGLGTSVVPVRFFSPPELAVFQI